MPRPATRSSPATPGRPADRRHDRRGRRHAGRQLGRTARSPCAAPARPRRRWSIERGRRPADDHVDLGRRSSAQKDRPATPTASTSPPSGTEQRAALGRRAQADHPAGGHVRAGRGLRQVGRLHRRRVRRHLRGDEAGSRRRCRSCGRRSPAPSATRRPRSAWSAPAGSAARLFEQGEWPLFLLILAGAELLRRHLQPAAAAAAGRRAHRDRLVREGPVLAVRPAAARPTRAGSTTTS